jgi:hypothetical protein
MLSCQLLKNTKRLGSTSAAPIYLHKEVTLPGKSVVPSDVTTPSDLTDKPIVCSLLNANEKRDYLVKLTLQKIHMGGVEIRKKVQEVF